jgi:hypothetical protein
MSAEEMLYTALSEAASIIAVVGARIDPDIAAEPSLPAIAFHNPETEYVVTLHDNLPVAVKPSIEIWCMGRTRKEADELAELVPPVVAPQSFIVTGRRAEIREGPPITFAAVLTVEIYEV